MLRNLLKWAIEGLGNVIAKLNNLQCNFMFCLVIFTFVYVQSVLRNYQQYKATEHSLAFVDVQVVICSKLGFCQ